MNQQCTDLLNHLREGNKISVAVAIPQLGIGSLPRRILDLKEAGHVLGEEWVKYNNAKGQKKRYKQWWLVKEKFNA